MNTATREIARLLNEQDAARYLNLTPRTLQNWRHVGGGPPFIRISARAVRYDPRDLDSWLQVRKVNSTSQYA